MSCLSQLFFVARVVLVVLNLQTKFSMRRNWLHQSCPKVVWYPVCGLQPARAFLPGSGELKQKVRCVHIGTILDWHNSGTILSFLLIQDNCLNILRIIKRSLVQNTPALQANQGHIFTGLTRNACLAYGACTWSASGSEHRVFLRHHNIGYIAMWIT